MAAAINTKAFAAAMSAFAPFEPNPVIAVALSGGADSLALATLVQDWCAERGGIAVALVVDHGLRDASAREAEYAAETARQLGLSAQVLTWDNGPAYRQESGKQVRARTIRYNLITRFCQDHNILHLATGHHGDDQAETRHMQQKRGAKNSKGIPAIWFGLKGHCPDIRTIRPLLSFSRRETEATCLERNLRWVTDPSNLHTAFERGQIRQSAALCADKHEQDIPPGVPDWLQAVHISPMGHAHLVRSVLDAVSTDDLVTGLSLLLRTIGNRPYPARQKQVLTAAHAIQKHQDHSLAHCRILHRRHRMWIIRETKYVLDGFELPPSGPDLQWHPVTEQGRLQIPLSALPVHFRDLPPAVIDALPCLKHGNTPCALPAFDTLPGWSERVDLSPPFVRFRPLYPASGVLGRQKRQKLRKIRGK